jgi:hypothetical protein
MSTIKKGLLPVAAVAACCALAACGSSSSNSSSSASATGSSSTTASASARRTALAACLKKHGVTLPSRPAGAGGGPPGSGTATPGANGAPPANGTPPANGAPPAGGYGGGGPGFFRSGGGRGFAGNPKFRAAFQACGGGQFRGRFRDGRPGNSATFRTALNKYVACVRQHGYDLPKPNFSGKGSVFPSSIQSNPKFRAASKACQGLFARPGAAPGGSSSSQTTTTSTT